LIKYIQILNVAVNYINEDNLHSQIHNIINSNKKKIIGNLNIHAANLAVKDKWFKLFIKKCFIIFCDGKGIQFGAWLLGKPIPKQITYHTWMWNLFEFCENKNISLFLLGSKPGVSDKAVERVLDKYPNLSMNNHHGFFKKIGKENEQIVNKINKFNPNILIVGFGMPLQEKWIMENKDKINTNVLLNGGAYLDWISGDKKQSPRIVTDLGFEWLYRFIKEPKRLFKRYIIGNPLFIYRIIRQRVNKN